MKLSQWEKEISKRLKEENPGVQPKERTITVRDPGETATINGFKTEKGSGPRRYRIDRRALDDQRHPNERS